MSAIKLIRKKIGADALVINIRSKKPQTFIIKIVDANAKEVLAAQRFTSKKRNERFIAELPFRDYVLGVSVKSVTGDDNFTADIYLKSDSFFMSATGTTSAGFPIAPAVGVGGNSSRPQPPTPPPTEFTLNSIDEVCNLPLSGAAIITFNVTVPTGISGIVPQISPNGTDWMTPFPDTFPVTAGNNNIVIDINTGFTPQTFYWRFINADLESQTTNSVYWTLEPCQEVPTDFSIQSVSQECDGTTADLTFNAYNPDGSGITDIIFQYSMNNVDWADASEIPTPMGYGSQVLHLYLTNFTDNITIFLRLKDANSLTVTTGYEKQLYACGGGSETLSINNIDQESCDGNVLTANFNCNIQNAVGIIVLQYWNGSAWATAEPQVINGNNSINVSQFSGQNTQFRLFDGGSSVTSNNTWHQFMVCGSSISLNSIIADFASATFITSANNAYFYSPDKFMLQVSDDGVIDWLDLMEITAPASPEPVTYINQQTATAVMVVDGKFYRLVAKDSMGVPIYSDAIQYVLPTTVTINSIVNSVFDMAFQKVYPVSGQNIEVWQSLDGNTGWSLATTIELPSYPYTGDLSTPIVVPFTYYYKIIVKDGQGAEVESNSFFSEVPIYGTMVFDTNITFPIKSVTLYLMGTAYDVDWGDGSPLENITSNYGVPVVHEYPAGGIYTATFIGNYITQLSVQGGSLTSLDVNGMSAMTILSVANNALTSIGLSGANSLVYLDVSHNSLSSIDLTGLFVQTLYVDYNNLTELTIDISARYNLLVLDCTKNNITALDVTGCTNLIDLTCPENDLILLDVSSCNNLQVLSCGGNQLASLNIAGLGLLTYLHCAINNLVSLSLATNTSLIFLQCNLNQLTVLDITGLSSLNEVYCAGNNISTGNINNILSWLASTVITNGKLTSNNQVPAAPPSGQGIVDKATLEAAPRYWTVTTD